MYVFKAYHCIYKICHLTNIDTEYLFWLTINNIKLNNSKCSAEVTYDTADDVTADADDSPVKLNEILIEMNV